MVYDVTQDTLGQLWFATRAGISVYDGSQWKSYTVVDGLPATNYSKVLIDDKGLIWILPYAPNLAISFFDNEVWSNLPKPKIYGNVSNFSSFGVTYLEQKRIVFVGTDNAGLYRFADGQWKQITVDHGLLSNQINGIVVYKGKLFIATDKGISILNGEHIDNSWNDRLHLPSKKIVGIALENEHDKIWLHGENWIGYIEDLNFHLFSKDVKCILDKLNHHIFLQPDLKGGIFYGNMYDVYHIEKRFGVIERLGRISGLITEGATSFLLDREKNLWITSQRGVSKVQSMRFKNYRKDHGLLENEVTAITEIESGKIIFGHENGLTFLENHRFRTLSFWKDKPGSEVRSRVLDLKVDQQKNIWVAASMLGLAKIRQEGRIEWFRKEAGFEGIVTSVLVDRQNRIWVSDRNGLHFFNGEKFVLFDIGILPTTETGRLFPFIRKIFQGPDTSLYLATSGKGMYLYKNNRWTQYIFIQDNRANNVYYILTDSRGRIWIGTLAGLFTLHNDNLIKYKSSNFEINRPVYLIVEDSKNRIWFGTDNGVIRWDGKEARGYTIHEGFVGQETNRAAGLLDSDGQLWIGADLGVSCYQEEFDYGQQDIPPPTFDLQNIEVAGEKLPLDKVNKLSYFRKTFIFHFRGISFIDEKTIRYRYKLEGYDDHWIFENRPYTQQVRYTKLSPGKYKFYIQAQNSLGCWSAVKSSEVIIIQNPFWNTLWFRIIAILSFVIILVLTYYGRVSMLNRKQRAQQAFSRKLIDEVEKSKRKIASELHDSLGQNLLITKNEITQCLILPDLPHGCTKILKEISAIISESINDIRQISQDLHPHQLDRLGLTRAIEAMINKVTRSLEIYFTHEIDEIDRLIPMEIGIHIYRIIQEGLNNIIRHANAKNVFIKIKNSYSTVKIVIKDDGEGFDYKKYAADYTQSKGLGLAGITERVKILNGDFKIDTVPHKGTKLIITIPKR